MDKFFTKYLDGKKYLAVHYRFDTNDWMNHCDGKDDNLTCERVVEVMHDVPKALANFADYVERQVIYNIISPFNNVANFRSRILRLFTKGKTHF